MTNHLSVAFTNLASNFFVRELTSILLLICLGLTILGYHLVFNFQLAAVKSEIKELLKTQKDNNNVVQITLSDHENKQVYWENENEFRYNNEMYDVIEKKVKGNDIIIRCIPDKKETALLNEYQKNNKHNSSNSTVIQLITAQFVLPADDSLRQPEKIVKRNFIDPSSSLQNIASTVPLPPPDVC
jgi:hypothetical protein